jgi:hypothetical protein
LDLPFHFFFDGYSRKEKVRSPAACFQKETAAQKAIFIPDP